MKVGNQEGEVAFKSVRAKQNELKEERKSKGIARGGSKSKREEAYY